MTITRRLFLGGILAATGAPAIVRSGVLMPVRPVIVVPEAMEQFAVLYRYTDASELLHEDDHLGYRAYVKATWEQRGIVLNDHWLDKIAGAA